MSSIVTAPASGDPVAGGSRPALAPSWWALGLTLAERRALPDPPPCPPEGSEAAERARRRLVRWHRAHKLAESGQFDRRLADLELDEAGLLALLAEEPTRLAERAVKPSWAEVVERVLDGVPLDRDVPDLPADEDAVTQAGFSVVVDPFTQLALARLDGVLPAAAGGLVDAERLRAGFIGQLGRRLNALAARTLILELNVLRVTGRLTGATPAERFWSFVRHFARPAGLAALLEEYPVLGRLLAQAAEQAAETWCELLDRLAADRSLIVDTILPCPDPGPLVEAAFGSGDQHGAGRSVALLRFADGARLVYKPRPLAVHIHFNQLLGWFNSVSPGLDLRALTVVDRGGYGWVEFVEQLPCVDAAGVARYHRRQGALLALLHALAANDFHHENLIACADQPVLVDVETLFHPAVPTGVAAEQAGNDPALAALERSVLQVGLLPVVVWGQDGSAVDLSGVGGDRGHRMPFKVVNWAAAGTDEMRVVRAQPDFPGSQNRPRLDGAEVDPTGYLADLLDGFRVGYRVIAQHRDTLTGEGGPLAAFDGDDVRVVVRSTQIYGTLLHESTHPDVLRDALDRDRIFDQLWALSVRDPVRERLAGHELAELWTADVPLFTTRPGSADLVTGRGFRVPNALDPTGTDRVRRTLDALSEDDLEVQQWIARASMATRPKRGPGHGHPAGAPASTPSTMDPPDPDRALGAARAIADTLANSAYHNDERVNWLGLELVDDTRWRVLPLHLDLYNGFPGVALFLGQLASLTGEQRYAELARAALGNVSTILDGFTEMTAEQRGTLVGCGVFSGSAAGLAYVLAQLGDTLGEPALPGWLDQIVVLLADTIDQDEVLDVIGGSAGCVAAMLAVAEAGGPADALDVAQSCVDRLVERAEPQEHGVAWYTAMDAVEPLTGFSHGAAGIGWALLRYAAATGDEQADRIGRAAWLYERHRYSAELANWPDLRVLDGREGSQEDGPAMYAWCHGCVGIGLARASIVARGTNAPDFVADLDLALRSMLDSPSTANHSLCHGELGNLELLTIASRPELAAERDRRAAVALHTIERFGPRCGTPGGIPTPGLLTGLAGIGHGLLRLGFGDRVPSALLLDPPAGR